MRIFFNISILSIFVVFHLMAVYMHSFQFDRAFFPFNSWKLYHSESPRTTPIVTVHIFRISGQEFRHGKDITTFPTDTFPQVRDRYELTNLLIQSYFNWTQKNTSEAKSFALQADKLLRHGHKDLLWKANFYKTQPIQYYLNPKIVETDKPLLTLSSASLYESI